jgi:tripartite ATP-independent transporter DctP family solute receptor
MTSTGVLSNFVPETGILDLPFIFRDKEHAREVMAGPVADSLAELLEASNFKVLSWPENGFRHVTNGVKPIETPEDLSGIKLRTMEVRSHQQAFQKMGADPTPMSWGEVFTSLQQGVIDGQENPITIIYQSKLFEVQKYLTLTGHVYSPTALMLGKDIFDGMPADYQQIVLDAAQTAKEANYEFIDNVETENIQLLKDEGMEIIEEVDKEAFMQAVQPVVDEHKSQFPDLYDQIVSTN